MVTRLTNTKKRRPCRRWTDAERHLVCDEYQRRGPVVLAARMARTVNQVKHMARRLRVCRQNHSPYRWTPSRRRAFADIYRRSPVAAASQFGLTQMTVNSYASRWGVHVRRQWESWEDDLIRELWSARRDDELMERTGRTLESLKNRAWKLGCRRPAVHGWTKWRFRKESQHAGT